MKKNTIVLLVVMAFGFYSNALADTFDISGEPVYVSGDSNGLITCVSVDPKSLDQLEGVMQYCNDTIKKETILDALYKPAKRISPNFMTVQLYEPALSKQFSFNFTQGNSWAPVPSCKLIPDGKTVITEHSTGGDHFSLIAHLTGKSTLLYKKADFPDCSPAKEEEESCNVCAELAWIKANIKLNRKSLESFELPDMDQVGVSILQLKNLLENKAGNEFDLSPAIQQIKKLEGMINELSNVVNQQKSEKDDLAVLLEKIEQQATPAAQQLADLENTISELSSAINQQRSKKDLVALLEKIEQQTKPFEGSDYLILTKEGFRDLIRGLLFFLLLMLCILVVSLCLFLIKSNRSKRNFQRNNRPDMTPPEYPGGNGP